MAPLAIPRRRVRSKTSTSAYRKSQALVKAAAASPGKRPLERHDSASSAASGASWASTRAPSSSLSGCHDSDSDSSPTSPTEFLAAKRRRIVEQAKRSTTCASTTGARRRGRPGARDLCDVVHQFGLVGGEFYDTRETRLTQLLERLPRAHGGSAPRVLLFADPASEREVSRAVAAHKKAAASEALPHVEILIGRSPRIPEPSDRCTLAINYDIPRTGEEYLRRGMVVREARFRDPQLGPAVLYTMVLEKQLESCACSKIRAMLLRMKRRAKADPELGDVKVAELDSAVQYLANEGEDEDDEDCDESSGKVGGEEDEDACDCNHCSGGSIGCVSLHGARPRPGAARTLREKLAEGPPRVEVVRVPLEALENISSLEPYIAPRTRGDRHACTMICLHNMYCHTPWDGYEHMFALPEGMGTVRVVMVLATGSSWHDYPDVASFSGGVAWTDILDMDSMDRADRLIDRLVEHEIGLLGGQSERLFLFGASQGGGQSMLRFLRSQRRLGGWIGSVCHVPTAPHAPVRRDPLTESGRPLANLDTPMRLLAGELDSTFPAALVLRDIDRIQEVGGFNNVTVTVQKGLTHEGPEASEALPPELVFLQEHLPSMVAAAEVLTSRGSTPSPASP